MPKGFDNLLTVLVASVVLAWLWFNRVAENWPISAASGISALKDAALLTSWVACSFALY